ncbi:transposase [Cohnella soli]|uniref:Transposase n=1 Tax=Cohnella soli TaxID=425005 RepID=A0ABW0HWY2_9BACL
MAKTQRRRFTPKQKAHIVCRLLGEDATVAQVSEEFGINPILLQRWKNYALSNLSKLYERDSKETEKLKASYEQRIDEMQEELDKLNLQLDWLKKVTAMSVPKENRSDLVRRDQRGLPIRTQTELLGLSRSTLYYRLRHPSTEVVTVRPMKHALTNDINPAILPAGLNTEQMKQFAELDLPKLKLQKGWMDVFGGFH